MTANRIDLWSVGVIIPARNEEKRIVECIRSVLAAIAACDLVHAWVVVVADSCTDNTVQLARETLATCGHVLECAVRSPGTARRLGAEAAVSYASSVPLSTLWLANTDADTSVPPDWLSKQLRMADAGAVAVAGIVDIDSFESHGAHGAKIFRETYKLNADGTHPHVHGANMGLRADAYVDAGGWSDALVGEDHCLWKRVKQRGWPVRSSTASVVVTSGRLRGRARGGFADTLRRQLPIHSTPMLEQGAP